MSTEEVQIAAYIGGIVIMYAGFTALSIYAINRFCCKKVICPHCKGVCYERYWNAQLADEVVTDCEVCDGKGYI